MSKFETKIGKNPIKRTYFDKIADINFELVQTVQ